MKLQNGVKNKIVNHNPQTKKIYICVSFGMFYMFISLVNLIIVLHAVRYTHEHLFISALGLQYLWCKISWKFMSHHNNEIVRQILFNFYFQQHTHMRLKEVTIYSQALTLQIHGKRLCVKLLFMSFLRLAIECAHTATESTNITVA